MLEKSRGVMIRQSQMLVLLFYKPNRNLHTEKFSYHLLLQFYVFTKKEDLFSTSRTYSRKSLDSVPHWSVQKMVCATVTENKQIFEPNNKLIDTLLAEILISEQEQDFYCNKQVDF